MSYIHQDILHRKKKCMFGKDEEPAEKPQFFASWISTDSGTTTCTASVSPDDGWTYVVPTWQEHD